MSSSRAINNVNDTRPLEYDDEGAGAFAPWPGDTIDEEVLEDEDTLPPPREYHFYYYRREGWDAYDWLEDAFGGSDLTMQGYERWWRSQSSGR